MTILLHLGCQGTAASRLILHIQRFADLRHSRFGKAWPIHSRVGQRLLIAQQVAVFDKEQRLDDERRDRGKIRIVMGRIPELVERFGAAIIERQPGLDLLGVGNKEATLGVVVERIGEMHLLADLIAPLQQPLLHHWQLYVSKSLVERAIFRESDLLALTGLNLIGELGSIARDLLRLQLRGFHLVANQSDHSPKTREEEETKQPAPPGTTLALGVPVRALDR